MEEEKNLPTHIAIIMDGNRRWAKEKKIEARLGHKAGADTLEKIAKYANKIGIQYLTVYAFSTENWKRTKEEVGALMFLLKSYLEDLLTRASLNNIKLNMIGDLSRLDEGLQKSIDRLMEKTKNNTGLTLNIAFNYGGRDEIVKTTQKIVRKVQEGVMTAEEINEETFANYLYTAGQPDPDFLIRTGGEKRISNYLLWQLAYTEFIFIDKYWPEFSEQDLDEAIDTFNKRTRKFGAK